MISCGRHSWLCADMCGQRFIRSDSPSGLWSWSAEIRMEFYHD